ncbi:MAG: GvpL/GvpF family gas vesicle protein [Firmicutes bacterium]|nr:GvpL/GvpF family gas vesicle protein [Bacillota bacterium]
MGDLVQSPGDQNINRESDPGARYVYCIIPRTETCRTFIPGIAGARVFTIFYLELGAVVHACEPVPYQGEDEIVKEWVGVHADIVDHAWQMCGTVIPMTFDVIIKGDEVHTAEENVVSWLASNYEDFKAMLDRFKCRSETGIQVIWDPAAVSEALIETDEDLKKIKTEMASKSKGLMYFYQQRLEKALKRTLDAKADEIFGICHRRIARYATEICTNKVKKVQGKEMLMNLSVLVENSAISELGEELDRIAEECGVEIRFTGPWPPYSFVTHENTPCNILR